MKIKKFKELEQKINGQNFNQSYKTINIVLTILSYFGHIASIFLAYFMLSKVLSGAMTDNDVAVFIASIIILSGIELLKRDIFDKFSIQFLKNMTISKDAMPLFFLSLLIISISFYVSIHGAQEFSSKEKQFEQGKKEVFTTYKDSVTLLYTEKINAIESKIESKDNEQTNLESQPASRQQRSRISDLKDEKNSLKKDRDNLKVELADNLSQKEAELSSDTEEKKKDNSKNSFMFIIISSFIEITILVGVFFSEYYKFRSYREFRNKIEKDPNYQKWMLYDQMLNIIYQEDTKINQKLPSNKSIIEMCKVNDIIVLPKDVVDFLKVMTNIGIVKSSGSTRYISKQRDLSFEALKKQFNVE